MRRVAWCVGLGIVALVACAKSNPTGTEAPDAGGGAPNDASLESSVGELPDAQSCVGLACNQVSCPNGGTTAIEGDVYDPGGKTKLYNAVVYVPNGDLQDIPSGTTACTTCDAVASGSPLVAALTDEAGHFRITNAPTGTDVPLIVQIGKWRRALKVPHVTGCQTTTVDDGVLRLPKNRSEGNIPQMAVVLGGYDRLGCMFSRIGVDPAEITAPSGTGRIHVYKGMNGGDVAGGGATDATTLWNDAATLGKYDAVFLECEGWEYDATVSDGGDANKTAAAKEAMRAYANAGGRVFAEHYHYTWFKNSPDADFRGVASWVDPGTSAYGSETLDVETGFPKGASFAKWLVNVGASPAPGGTLAVDNPSRNVNGVTAGEAQSWLTHPGDRQPRYFTFNTPVGAPAAKQCGRAVFTDVHVHEGLGAYTLPTQCDSSPMTPQELALEFLMFDLTSCVQPDSQPPQPPIK